MKQRSSTIAIKSNDHILLLKRGKTAPYMPERYCLPGGRLDDDESLEECCVRELSEETGIIVDIKSIEQNTIRYRTGNEKIVFSIELDNPEVKLNWEHDDYVWVDSKTISKYNLVPGLRTTLNFLFAK